MRAIQKITDQKTEDCIPQKLQLFVIQNDAALFVGMRAVRKSLSEQLEIFECVAKLCLQSRKVHHIEINKPRIEWIQRRAADVFNAWLILLSDLGSDAFNVIVESLLGLILLNV